MDIGCEDVFDSGVDVTCDTEQTTLHVPDVPASTQQTLTFVGSSYTQIADDNFCKTENEKNLKNIQHALKTPDNQNEQTSEKKTAHAQRLSDQNTNKYVTNQKPNKSSEVKNTAHAQRPLELNLNTGHQIFSCNGNISKQKIEDGFNDKTMCKQTGLSPDSINNNKTSAHTKSTNILSSHVTHITPSKQDEYFTQKSKQKNVIEKQKDSKTDDKNLLEKQNNTDAVPIAVKESQGCSDVSDLQNRNNEKLLVKMKKGKASATKYSPTDRTTLNISDDVIGIFLLISCSTFMALCFDMPPGTFIFDVFLAFVMKSLLEFVFKEC